MTGDVTYLTTDEPFGTMSERLMRRVAVMLHLRPR